MQTNVLQSQPYSANTETHPIPVIAHYRISRRPAPELIEFGFRPSSFRNSWNSGLCRFRNVLKRADVERMIGSLATSLNHLIVPQRRGGLFTRLRDTPEFGYIRTLMPDGAPEEDGPKAS